MTEPLAVFDKIKINIDVAVDRLDRECTRAIEANDRDALLVASAKYDRLLQIVSDLGDKIHALPEK